MIAIKLAKCKECFEISGNKTYAVARGHQITVYKKADWSVQCVVPRKVINHPYAVRFLTESIFIAKNNAAEYLIYDVANQELIWKFKVRGYISIDKEYVLSPDGSVVFDIVEKSNNKPGQIKRWLLLIFPWEKRYEVRELDGAMPPEKNVPDGFAEWDAELTLGHNQQIYMLRTYHLAQRYSEEDPRNYERRMYLYTKTLEKDSQWRFVKQWHCNMPKAYGTQLGNGITCMHQICQRQICQRPIYWDDRYVVWNDLTYENYITGEQGQLVCGDRDPSHLKHKSYPDLNIEICALLELDPLFCRRIWAWKYPEWKRIQIFSEEELDTLDRVIDFELLDESGTILVGTWDGIYLCTKSD